MGKGQLEIKQDLCLIINNKIKSKYHALKNQNIKLLNTEQNKNAKLIEQCYDPISKQNICKQTHNNAKS